MVTRRAFTASGLAAGLLAAAGPAGAAGPASRPVVVELFTSQGCSSCPPADAFLGELARRDDVVALAFHVDYWDYIGWKDPFGDPLYTARQRAYAARLRQRSIYTPQMVIDGITHEVGSRRDRVEAAIEARLRAGPAERVSIPIEFGRRSDGPVTVIVPKAAATGPADLMLAAVDAEHVTEVRRGENSGRVLSDYNVVRSITRIGRWTGDELAVTVDPDTWHRGADFLAVLLQGDQGDIWGVTRIPL
ncbi:MAG: DUF1223 domain-containing protein [Thalassobaculum sp.]|uniref:DUF1223 domain-containing protein n=1 Tax=Thalassobaculum sp. TaxID=2022740 RepID=UPI0032ED75FB